MCAAVLLWSGFGPMVTSASAADTDAARYLAMLNHERTSAGLAPLAVRSDLSSVAYAWSAHMASTGQLVHNPELASQVSNWQAVGENVGDGPTIDALDDAFWNSPPHRANILDAGYREIGAAAVHADGIIWITVVFRQPLNTPSVPTQAPAPTAQPALGGTPPAPAIVAPSVLARGTNGDRVARVQRLLHVHTDGLFGPVTEHAVIRFQRHRDLRVDGIVGPRTLAALRRAARAARAWKQLNRRDVSMSPAGTRSAGCVKRLVAGG